METKPILHEMNPDVTIGFFDKFAGKVVNWTILDFVFAEGWNMKYSNDFISSAPQLTILGNAANNYINGLHLRGYLYVKS